MWWGTNPRAVVLLSPKTQSVTMSFDSMTVSNETTLGVYLGTTQVGQLQVYGRPSPYSVNMTVPKGYSEIAFYSTGSETSAGQYADFGINNITFSAG
jgi:hypothetical protein